MGQAEPPVLPHLASPHLTPQVQEVDLFGEISGISFSPDAETFFVGVADLTYSSLLEYDRCHMACSSA